MKSKLFSVNMKDGIRGVILAGLTAAGTAMLQVLNTGVLPDRAGMKTVGIAGVASGLSYVIKNFLTNSQDQAFKAEPSNEHPNS